MTTCEIIGVSEAAIILCLSHRRINKLLNDGRFEGAKLHSFGWLIPLKSVEDFAKAPRKRGRPVTTGVGLKRKDRREKISNTLDESAKQS